MSEPVVTASWRCSSHRSPCRAFVPDELTWIDRFSVSGLTGSSPESFVRPTQKQLISKQPAPNPIINLPRTREFAGAKRSSLMGVCVLWLWCLWVFRAYRKLYRHETASHVTAAPSNHRECACARTYVRPINRSWARESTRPTQSSSGWPAEDTPTVSRSAR